MISVNKRIGSVTATLVALSLLTTACSSSSTKTSPTTAATTVAGTTATTATTATTVGSTVAAGTTAATSAATTAATTVTTTAGTAGAASGVTTTGISDAECAANKAAGKITYISSFDFAASVSIIDVVVAKEKGYFDKMCLDVSLVSGFSTSNYPLVAAGQAQFSSAGSYTEILNFSKDGASFVALVDYGKAPIEALITKDGGATDLSQLKGKTIGVKGDIPPSIVALLANAGLKRGTDYKEVLVDGFDPQAQLKLPIDALPVYKSNEPGQLDRASVKYNLFDPVKVGVPGSFGLIYASKDYAAAHPTVVADFARASLKGMEDVIADPAAAVGYSIKLIDAAGNSNFLTTQGETYRLQQEIAVVGSNTPAGEPVGLIDPAIFDKEYSTYVADGVWPKGAPADIHAYLPDVAKSVYDKNGVVIWPAN